MNTMRYLLPVIFISVFGFLGMAEDKAKTTDKGDLQDKIQMHENMAAMHTKAADCLKLGKSEEECHSEMMTMCKEMKGNMDCPMMAEAGKMHKGMHGHWKHEHSEEHAK